MVDSLAAIDALAEVADKDAITAFADDFIAANAVNQMPKPSARVAHESTDSSKPIVST